MKANFDRCLTHVFASEGGYVNHPVDPGGATNMGITHGTLSRWRGKHVNKSDVRDLTRAEAAAIYRAWYWDKVRADDLPSGLDLVAFDAAVNSGPARGAKWLQQALGVVADGYIGPQTLDAARGAVVLNVINEACDIRLDYLKRLSTWPVFGRGWSGRVSEVRSEAMDMAMHEGTHRNTAIRPKAPKKSPMAALLAILAAIFGGRK